MASALALFELNTRFAPLRDVSVFTLQRRTAEEPPSAVGCNQTSV
jgi:hypothetical protein